ncbi:MAG TPA: DUF222 domain-containing protein [Mycobacterium sp.]|nr:DUF222 domain-containing protein [Mycobacterium sp.]
MFDTGLPDVGELAGADESLVVAAITGWASIEAAAAARRLAAIAELVARRIDGPPAGTGRWACDDWDAAAAEVAGALNVSHGKASGQMYLATALRDRLPEVARVFAEGMLSAQLVATIAWYTTLIQDREALALVDKTLARDALRYGPLSANKTSQAIEAIVDRHDPGALRRTRVRARSREVVIDKTATENGTTPLWGRLYAADAEVLDRRLMAMAHQVCDDDPRTIAQRRADALGVLAGGGDRLMCGCGSAECSAAEATSRAGSVVIHVVADEDAMETPPDPHLHGAEPPPRPISWDMKLDELPGPEPEPDPPARSKPAMILGGPVVPGSLLAELIAAGATIRRVRIPGADSPPERGYRPSTALDEFVRIRDMTCRFPGCDAPAEFCDLDHTIAYGVGGLTHPSNLKCVCRKHHLLKTFWGWNDRQLPDGTVIWTSPTGVTYTTHPGSRLLFPALCRSTGELPASTTPSTPMVGRTLMMPTRKRTRAQNRARAINAERALNDAHVAERNRPPPF